MKNAVLALLAAGILVAWILSTENRGKDPKIFWKRGNQTASLAPAANPGGNPVIPVKDPALQGCFEGTLVAPGSAALQLYFFRSLEPEEERYRFTIVQGGVRHPWQGPVGSLRALPPPAGFASGYAIPLRDSRAVEIFFDPGPRSWSGTLYSISSSNGRESAGSFVLRPADPCR